MQIRRTAGESTVEKPRRRFRAGPAFLGATTSAARAALAAIAMSSAGLATLPAAAAGQDATFQNDEVTLQLVRAADPVDDKVRTALLVSLAPGWHSYWLDPGASGVPPQIDLSATKGAGSVRQRLPAPRRFGEGETRANGYEGEAAFAYEIAPEKGATIGTVKATVFMGVCKEICIPVTAELATDGSDPAAEAAVAAAFAALPEEAPDGAVTVSAAGDGKTLRVAVKNAAAEGTSGDTPDLFVTSGDGWFFDEPTVAERTDDATVFDVPVVESPASTATAPASVDVLVTAGGGRGVEARSVPVSPGS
ncbi:protein-disulfide reductase DsbD domain-containing protein [Jiella sonneratiae]|uniref:Thiol:disulfide interchange protein DsbD N-terminal domain-containing protein n=1 Tax=Jiella sonneratiae TaxID=2816856 RepID=A0ABS3J4H5_9HYPH|nr:protein-disulfide reductase DsbD domain-containing protein [Jiella sonneratiae]MBO0904581.1 hypothetical protein [Jiella sonneratiae]